MTAGLDTETANRGYTTKYLTYLGHDQDSLLFGYAPRLQPMNPTCHKVLVGFKTFECLHVGARVILAAAKHEIVGYVHVRQMWQCFVVKPRMLLYCHEQIAWNVVRVTYPS